MLDLYCERTAPGLFGEPFNLITNAAYLAVAVGIWRLRGADSGASAILAALAAAIAAGSTAFHATALPATRILDELPIAAFQIAWLWTFGRATGWTGRTTAALAVLVFGTSLLLRAAPPLVNGSLPYVPALAVLLVLGLAQDRRTETWSLMPAALLFALGITFRSADAAVCASMPIGTHFLWHLATAGVIYLVSVAALRLGPPDLTVAARS